MELIRKVRNVGIKNLVFLSYLFPIIIIAERIDAHAISPESSLKAIFVPNSTGQGGTVIAINMSNRALKVNSAVLSFSEEQSLEPPYALWWEDTKALKPGDSMIVAVSVSNFNIEDGTLTLFDNGEITARIETVKNEFPIIKIREPKSPKKAK